MWQQNRPLNAQMVADALQVNGIKKTAVQKVMDTLTANGKISFKDYGKQRVCVANQTQFEIPDIDELDAMKKQNDQLLADVAAVRSHVSELEAGVLRFYVHAPRAFSEVLSNLFSFLI